MSINCNGGHIGTGTSASKVDMTRKSKLAVGVTIALAHVIVSQMGCSLPRFKKTALTPALPDAPTVMPSQANFSSSNPSYLAPSAAISPSSFVAPNRSLSDEELLDAWNVFGDPRLRWVQAIGLQNAASSLSTDGKRRLLTEIAQAVTVARFHLNKLQTLEDQRRLQIDTLEDARIRVRVGSATKADLVQLVARAQQTEALRPKVLEACNDAIEEVERRIGQTLTEPLRDALGDQPPLRLNHIIDRIAAKELRNRCDVYSAEQRVQQLSYSTGIAEAELLPSLALKGYIRPKQDPNSLLDSDPMTFELEGEENWEFSAPSDQLRGSPSSPIGLAMHSYHSVVTTAASEVKELLTKYLRARTKADGLAGKVDNLADQLRKTIAQFEVDRAKAGDLVIVQGRVIEAEYAMHAANFELALIAIDLFEAIGGPCHMDLIIRADYYETQP